MARTRSATRARWASPLPAGPAAALAIPNGGPGVGRLALPPAAGSGPPQSPVSAKTVPTQVDGRHEPGLSYGATAADVAAANIAAATERSNADYMAAATEAAAIDRQIAELVRAHQRGTNMWRSEDTRLLSRHRPV